MHSYDFHCWLSYDVANPYISQNPNENHIFHLMPRRTLSYSALPYPVARRPSLPAPVLGVPAPPTLQAMPILGNRMIGAAFTAGETGTKRKNSEVLI